MSTVEEMGPMTRQPPEVAESEVVLHGQRVTYRACGEEGPLVLLLHGITGSSETWDPVIPLLGRSARVIAPDLLGHGRSAKPVTGDYSLGAWAAGLRDLLVALGHERATVVGHSLGGGVALQFAYQFPERCERLVLVNSGGLGRAVHPMLRAVALPLSEHVLPLVVSRPVRRAGDGLFELLRKVRLQFASDYREAWDGLGTLSDPDTRRAFVRTVRSVIGVNGQQVSARNRLYLAEEMPTLLLVGGDDEIIPARHSLAAHELIPGSQLQVVTGAGHFPHRDRPGLFVGHLLDFLDATEPSDVDPERWGELLCGSP
jgi:pimeloyl-ACP methyl ester carboxylesterase